MSRPSIATRYARLQQRVAELEVIVSSVRDACYYQKKLTPLEGRTPVFTLNAAVILAIVGADPDDERFRPRGKDR